MKLHLLAHPVNMEGNGYYRVVLPINNIKQEYPEILMHHDMRFPPLEMAQGADRILFQWQYKDFQLEIMKSFRRHSGAKILFEIDDNILALQNGNFLASQMPKDVVKRVREACAMADHMIVTTDYLADSLSSFHKDIRVAPNAVPPELYRPVPKGREGKVRIGWAGSISHGADLSIIEDVVKNTADKVQWVFFGMVPESIKPLVEFHEGVQFAKYYETLVNLDLDIAIAPIDDNEFNRCKSPLKMLEYGSIGCAVIASDVPPYSGWPALTVKNRYRDWLKAVNTLVDDREMRFELASKLQEKVRADHLVSYHTDTWMKAWDLPDEVDCKDAPIIKNYYDESSEIVTSEQPKVSVIIPVWAGNIATMEATARCFESIATAKVNTPFELIVVFDGIANESLENQAHDLGALVLFNEKNLGFGASVNSAAVIAGNHDFVILNSDTQVTDGWLDALVACAEPEDVASVTPLSNNGELASYPIPFTYNDKPIDASKLPPNRAIEVPVGVGFCMYIKRKVWDEVGTFDAKLFPEGYGEETEWCLRAAEKGFKHLLCGSAYVWHDGGVSFGSRKKKLSIRALDIIKTKYPEYLGQVMSLPQKMMAFHRDTDIFMYDPKSGPSTLFIGHALGGGAEHWLQEEMKKCDRPLVMRPVPNTTHCWIDTFRSLSSFDLQTEYGHSYLEAVLRALNVTKIVVSEMVGYPFGILQFLQKTIIPYEVQIHDFYMVCPEVHMAEKGDFCNAPDLRGCQMCMKGRVDMENWRNWFGPFLAKAKKIQSPSEDTKRWFLNYYPDLKISVKPHEPDIEIPVYPVAKNGKVLLIGTIHPVKGASLIVDVIKYAHEIGSKVQFEVLGQLYGCDAVAELPNVTLHGPYENWDVNELIEEINPSCAFLPFLWPETWSYTLSELFTSGIHPVTFDIGAPAARIRDRDFGTVLPWSSRKDISRILSTLESLAF